MKRRIFLEVAGTALTGTAANTLLRAKGKNSTSSAESLILDLERKWMDAMVRRDESTLKDIMAEDFKRIEKPWPNIAMYRPQWIGNTIRFHRVENFRFLSVEAKVSEKTDVVSVCYRWRSLDDERPFHETITAEDTWEQRDGKWQVVYRFVSDVVKGGSAFKTNANRKAIKLDPAVYAAYVGQYKFGNNRILTISREGDQLIHQGSGGHRAELFPETKNQFFRKDAPVLTSFVKDGQGQVTQVIHRHTSGRVSIGHRIA